MEWRAKGAVRLGFLGEQLGTIESRHGVNEKLGCEALEPDGFYMGNCMGSRIEKDLVAFTGCFVDVFSLELHPAFSMHYPKVFAYY